MATLSSKPLTWFKVAPQARTHFDEDELRLLGESLKVKQPQRAENVGRVQRRGEDAARHE